MFIRLLVVDLYGHRKHVLISVFKLFFFFFSSSQDKFPQHQTSNFNIKIK